MRAYGESAEIGRFGSAGLIVSCPGGGPINAHATIPITRRVFVGGVISFVERRGSLENINITIVRAIGGLSLDRSFRERSDDARRSIGGDEARRICDNSDRFREG